jgi:hypothetical protein
MSNDASKNDVRNLESRLVSFLNKVKVAIIFTSFIIDKTSTSATRLGPIKYPFWDISYNQAQ